MKVPLILIEPMAPQHLDRILEIEKVNFAQPYSREIFQEELTLDIAHPHVIYLHHRVVGFIDYWIVKDEIHLINIAVDPAYKRQNLATELMQFMFDQASAQKVTKIFLDVRKSNAPAIGLYDKFGFKQVSVRKRYYSDNKEDALVMVKEI